jgi:hypothetical protein
MMKAVGRRQKAESQKPCPQLFQQGGFIPLLMRTRIISVFCGLIILLVACCPPATNSSLQETAFTATFLGFSPDGQYLLAKSEQSNTDVQLIYNNTENLVVGQKVYVVGRLEGNVVYVTNIQPIFQK